MRAFDRLLPVLVLAVMSLGCEKEEEALVDPTAGKADVLSISVNKDTILTGGRESSEWLMQLTKDGEPFQKGSSINLSTDLGYFVESGVHVQRVTIPTDQAGSARILFYGDKTPGVATTLAWGDGFGVDTVRTVLILGTASQLGLQFKDVAEGVWTDTDTLFSGDLFGKPDSTLVQVTVVDRHSMPLPSVRVDLLLFKDGQEPRPPFRSYGYFATTVKPDSATRGVVHTDGSGEAYDVFYSDNLPNNGEAILEIEARVDSALFGRILTLKRLLVKAP
jgi:hypothetical protein